MKTKQAMKYATPIAISLVLFGVIGWQHAQLVELESQLKICAHEIENECPMVSKYAAALEKENDRLNKKARRLQKILNAVERYTPE